MFESSVIWCLRVAGQLAFYRFTDPGRTLRGHLIQSPAAKVAV